MGRVTRMHTPKVNEINLTRVTFIAGAKSVLGRAIKSDKEAPKMCLGFFKGVLVFQSSSCRFEVNICWASSSLPQLLQILLCSSLDSTRFSPLIRQLTPFSCSSTRLLFPPNQLCPTLNARSNCISGAPPCSPLTPNIDRCGRGFLNNT